MSNDLTATIKCFPNGTYETRNWPDDDLAVLAATAYGHCLNAGWARNRAFTMPEFADAIADVYDINNPNTQAVVNRLRGGA